MKRPPAPVFEGPEFPKRPTSAYLLFSLDKRRTLPTSSDVTPADNVKKLAEMWRNLPRSEKQVYEERHLQLKKEHEVEVATFLEGLGSKEEQKKYMSRLTEYRRKKREHSKQFRLRKLGLVQPCCLNAYNVFVKENAKQFLQDFGSKDGMRALSGKWNSLTQAEKEVYAVRADALSAEKLAEYQEKYKEAMEKGIVKPTKEKEAPKVTHKRTS